MTKQTLDAIRKAKKVTTQECPIMLDPQLSDDLRGRKRDLGRAKLLDAQQEHGSKGQVETTKKVKALERQCAALEKKVEAATVMFEFRALGRQVMGVLLKKNRPTAEQIADFHEGLKDQGLPVTETLAYDPDRFPAILIARSCISHDFDDDEALDFWNDPNFSAGELGQIFQAAWAVNEIIKR